MQRGGEQSLQSRLPEADDIEKQLIAEPRDSVLDARSPPGGALQRKVLVYLTVLGFRGYRAHILLGEDDLDERLRAWLRELSPEV